MGYTIPEQYRVGEAPGKTPETAVTIEWFGTAAFRISAGGTTLLIDPFVTRCGLLRMLFSRLRTNEKLCAELFPRADHILVGHSHYDHLMDVPAVARTTGATVHGSPSTAAVLRGAGADEAKISVVEPGRAVECGAFRVTFIPGLHGKVAAGRVPLTGEITGAPAPPLRSTHYRVGGVFCFLIETGGFRIMQMSSSDLIDDEMAKVGPVDALMVCLAGRKYTPDFMRRLNGHLKPRFVIPHHYDNFFRPLRSEMKLVPGVNMEGFFAETAAECPRARVLMPEMMKRVAFDASTRELV